MASRQLLGACRVRNEVKTPMCSIQVDLVKVFIQEREFERVHGSRGPRGS